MNRIDVRTPLLGPFLAVALAVLALAVTGANVVSAVPTYDGHVVPFGKFAGYNWYGQPQSISAEWVVPRIKRGSQSGWAGTWVGIEGPGFEAAPFIQIGTNEQRVTNFISGHSNDYVAFWSDTDKQFHPLILFKVHAGDRIKASMQLRGRRWQLEISDLTSGHSKSFTTTEEARGAFNAAEWIQEDVTDGATGEPFPYPALTDVHMQDVTVNSTAPTAAVLQPVWMSIPGRLLAGTPLRHDGFEVKPAIAPADAVQYRWFAVHLDTAANVLSEQLAHFPASDDRAALKRAVHAYVRALRINIAQFSTASWQPRTQGLVQGLIGASQSALDLALAIQRARGAQLRPAVNAFQSQVAISGESLPLVQAIYKPGFLPGS